MVNDYSGRRQMMNREMICAEPVTGKKGAALMFWLRILFLGVLLFSAATTAFALGGDPLPPFPLTDQQGGRQEARAMAVDSAGNIIVAGYGNSGGMNNDYLVVKFRADGSGVAWRASLDRSGGDDQIAAVAVDGNNDIIVTGTVWNAASVDIHTVKYSGADGTLLWQHTWSGAAGGSDIATSLAVDAANNIYVAGYTANASGNDDYLILKYPSAGSTPLWQEIRDSGYNGNDRITSIVAGMDGIAVTGASSKGGTDFDILTRKYGFDGSLVWEQRRGSAGSGDDRGVAVAMDPSGNVIVAGYLANGTNKDMLVAKYATAAPGTVIWERVHDGGNNDEPRAVKVDGGGDVYLTGYAYTYAGNEDIYTARYGSADGATVWEAVYDSGRGFADFPVGIAVGGGSGGDVFVAGYTATSVNENFTVLKYKKGNGELVWQSSYNGPGYRNDRPAGLALNGNGDVCVGGWSDSAVSSYDLVAITYDHGSIDPPTGLVATATGNTGITLSWRDNAASESGFRIERKLGENGTFTEIGTTGPDVTTFNDQGLDSNSYYYYRVRSYDIANGNSAYSNEAHALTKVVSYDLPAWIYRYNGADNREDEAVAIVAGADNHPVVTGFSDLAEEGVAGAYSFDYMTIKLDRADSTVKWKARYDSGDGGTDMAAGVTLDGNGDAIVTGTAYLSGGAYKSDDLYTIKYSSAGYSNPNANPPVSWGSQYGTQAGIDQATAIQTARDSSDNVIVIGHGINAALNEDMFVIKYRPDGTTPWPPIVYDGGTGGNDYPSAVATDSAGDIFITGSTENLAGNFDIYTAKYSGVDGTLLWSQIYAGAGNGDDHGTSLAVDNKGDVYMTGYAVGNAGNEEWVTIKYAGANNAPQRELWRAVYNGPAAPVNGNDRGISVALDPIDGEVVVAGTSYVSATDSDFHLIRYHAADGAVIWERNFDRPASYDYVTAMAVDSSGYIYLTGNSRSGPDTNPAFDSSSDILTLIYDFEGTFLGATTYNGGLRDEARAIAVNYQGEAFVAGVTNNLQNPDYLVLKQKNNYILVPAPFTLTPQADSTRMALAWRENTAGTKFRVERTSAPVLPTSVWAPVTTAAPGTTSFVDSGLASGGSYCYRIYAFSESPSLNSRTIESCSVTTLAATTLNPLSVDSPSQITLNWSQIAGNSGYRIERRTGTGGWAELAIKAADVTTHIDTGLVSGTIYYYRVSTGSPSGWALPSNEQSAPTRPVAPTLAGPANITNTQMSLSWNSVTGAASYTLQYRLSGGSYADFPSCVAIGGTTCTVTGLVPDSAYSFRVKATNTGGDSGWSNETGGTAALAIPTWSAWPTNPSDITSGGMTVTWVNPVVPGAGVITYTLQYRPSGGSYADGGIPSACGGTTALSCSVTGLAVNTTYYYRIRAANAVGSSGWSSELSGRTLLATPSLTSAVGGDGQTLLSWTPVADAVNYNVQLSRCTGSDTNPASCDGVTDANYGPWATVNTASSAATYTVTSLPAGTNYRFRVYAAAGVNGSDTSNLLNAWTNLTPPTVTVTPASSIALNLSWSQSPGETNYTVLVSTTGSAGSYTPVAAATGLALNTTGFQHAGLALNSTYCYKVTAYSTVTGHPADATSAPVCATTPPDAPVLSVTTNEFESSYSVIEDSSKNWPQADYFINRPVVITSGGNTYTKRVAGSVNSALFASPAFVGETVNSGDSYTILQTVSGRATGNDPGLPSSSLFDANKNWGMNEWVGFKIRITGSANAGNVGLERSLAGASGQINVYASANFAAPIVAGDTYQIASFFGTATAAGSATVLTHTGNGWSGANWAGYYLLMTSGSNSGHARKIVSNTASALTTDPFPSPSAAGDTYLIAPVAKVAPYVGTAAGAGSSATTLVDTGNVWQANYTGYYLQMTSGSNQGQARLITANNAAAKTITVSPAFASVIAPGDTYALIPSAQFAAYYGTAMGSPGTGATQLVDTGNNWLTDWSQGYFLMMTSGSNNGQMRTISGKTATTLTVSSPFPYPIAPTDTYLIGSATATAGSGRLSTAVTPSSTAKGTAKISLAAGSAEFTSMAPGYGNNYNHELLSLRDLTPLWGNFDASFDYTASSGLITADSSLPYLYLMSSYAALRFDFQSPAGKTYNTTLYRGRIVPQDSGKTTAATAATLSDTRTMAGLGTPWKNWGVDQWKDFYLQMTSGANAQLVRRVTGNTASGITLDSPFPVAPASGDTYRINVIAGTAAINGSTQDGRNSTNALLVDSSDNSGTTLPPKNWGGNQWAGFHLYMSSGPNIGLFRTISSNTANTIRVDPPFPYQIASGDSYTIFDPRPAAQAVEAHWVSIVEPVTNVNEQLIFPTSDTAGKLRLAKSGGSLQFYTAPSVGGWQLRRQLDLAAGDIYTPSALWVFQLGRLPHSAGTTVRTTVGNFQFTLPTALPTTFSPTYWTPEVGHLFRRASLVGAAVEAAWDRMTTAVSYEVERCPSNDHQNPAGRVVDAPLCTTFVEYQPAEANRVVGTAANAGLVGGYTYRFRVRAKDNNGTYTAWSNEQWVTVAPPAPTIVAPTASGATTGQLTPTWNNVNGDIGYNLYWKVRSGTTCSDDSWNGPIVLAATATGYNHSGLFSGTFYCYKMVAVGPSGPPATPDSTYSNIVSQTTKPATPGTITFSAIGPTSLTLSWPQVTGNSGYQIDRSLDNVTWNSNVATVGQDVTTYTNSGLAPGTLYYYRVSAASAGGFSGVSAVQSTTTTPATPTMTAAAVSASRIDLSWPLVSGATDYRVEMKPSSGSYSEIGSVSATYAQTYCGSNYPTVACPTPSGAPIAYQASGLSGNSTYCFHVRSWNNSGGYSAYSSEQCVPTLAIADQTLVATPLNSFKIRLDWTQKVCTPNPCDPPEGYEVERMVREGVWVKIATVDALAMTFIDRLAIEPIKQYRYRVRSFRGTSRSPYAEAVTYTPPYGEGDNVNP